MTAAPPRSGRLPGARLSFFDLAEVAAVRVAVSAGVLLLGFRAVSDDDYSRVVIAQQFAAAPRLDPSGTSWLPFPFWVSGGAMALLGRQLFVAQAVAFVLGVIASLLVAVAAHRLTAERRAARIAGGFATLLGWSAWLGVATVPEALTAALTLFAAASLASRSPRHRLEGALALLVATLSRYEPWPVALGFALGNLALPADAAPEAARRSARAFRLDGVAGGPKPQRAARAVRSIATSLLALAGPLAWIAWNGAAHGDPFHFVARVAAYRRALGDASSESAAARLIAYPIALASEMPEVALAAAAALLLALVPARREAITRSLRRHAAPLALALLQIAALSFALAKDSAPTHHPERAVLFPAFALAVFCGDVAASLRGLWARLLCASLAVALLARAAVTPRERREKFAQRETQIHIGTLTAEVVPASTKVLIEVDDYGYFAILAASGRPEDFVLSRDLDPRHPSEPPRWESEEDYARWLRRRGIGFLIAASSSEPGRAERWGAKAVHERGGLGLWQVPEAR